MNRKFLSIPDEGITGNSHFRKLARRTRSELTKAGREA